MSEQNTLRYVDTPPLDVDTNKCAEGKGSAGQLIFAEESTRGSYRGVLCTNQLNTKNLFVANIGGVV